jgi:hypothetical protein
MGDGAPRVSAPAAGVTLAQPVSSSSAGKLKVFISYSRKDEDFAQELLIGLQITGFEPYLDKHDIAAGEDWEQRLGSLIEAADTVVFVVSPDAMASDRCAWEVNRTVDLKKRLLPIVFRRVEEAQVPPRLKQLNYIFFDRPFSFAPSLQALATALRTDVEWVREHTRIGELALRWDGRGRAEALLLRGEELAAAKTWLAAQPQYAPEPTLLHHEFIKAGEDAEIARAGAERKRLDDMATAQAERQSALDDAQTALKREAEAQAGRARARRIIAWVSATAALVIVSGALAFAALQARNGAQQVLLKAEAQEQAARAVQQKLAVDDLIRRIRAGRSEPSGIDAMRKICDEAIKVTANLAKAPADVENAKLFWELYWGPMNIIEIREKTEHYSGDSATISLSPIESAMVAFGSALHSPEKLMELAQDVKKTCDQYLK